MALPRLIDWPILLLPIISLTDCTVPYLAQIVFSSSSVTYLFNQQTLRINCPIELNAPFLLTELLRDKSENTPNLTKELCLENRLRCETYLAVDFRDKKDAVVGAALSSCVVWVELNCWVWLLLVIVCHLDLRHRVALVEGKSGESGLL